MRKLLLTCDCGERLQVPRSAIGRTGLCPSCGRTIAINASNTTAGPAKKERSKGFASSAKTWWHGNASPSEEARQQFAQAVDFYFNRRYAEALMVFAALAKQFPNNPDIEAGRQECLKALRTGQGLALEDRSGFAGAHHGSATVPPGRAESVEPPKLDDEAVKRIVLEKLLYGRTDEVQLKAAELAWRILHDGRVRQGKADESQRAPSGSDTSSSIRHSADDDGEGLRKTQEEELDPLSEWTGFSDL
jgi:hypothetical protein